MKIGIVGGTGKEGSGLALRFALAGHSVMIGSRDAERGQASAEELSESIDATITGGSNEDAVDHGEVVILSVPFKGHKASVEALKENLAGKIMIDLTVPLQPPKVTEVHLPEGESAALIAQSILGDDTTVVGAFHHVSSVNLAKVDKDLHTDVLVVSDDKEARQTVIGLIEDMGATAVDAGGLRNSIALESLTPILIHINKTYKVAGSGLHITGINRDED
jgi:NADPH-dependent F420 reductase